MRILYQASIMITAVFFMVGCTTRHHLDAVSAGMNQQQVIKLMGLPTDSATQRATTLLVYAENPQAPRHFIFLNNQLVEYGQENRQSGHKLPSASAQLNLWLSEQNKAVNPSAIAGCKMRDQQVDCGV